MNIFILISKEYASIKAYSNQIQFSSVAQSCLTLWDPMNCSTPGLPVHHQLPEFTQTHVHQIGDAIQPSHTLSSPFPPAVSLFQHQSLFKWVSSSHQVAKWLEFQLQHPSFQWIFRTVRSLLEKAMATHSSTLVWKIPWTEEPGRATVHGVAKSRTRPSNFTFFFTLG